MGSGYQNMEKFLNAINNRSFSQFRELEIAFVSQDTVEEWQEYFNFQLLPSLDRDSNQWLLKQFLGRGTNT